MIRPVDFTSDTPPPRIIGTETEYSVQPARHIRKDSSDTTVIRAAILTPRALEALGLGPQQQQQHHGGFAIVRSNGQYLPNGARMYLDMHNYLEYCTPESQGPLEAARAERAGISIVQALAALQPQQHSGVYMRTGFTKTATDTSETAGYHENYLIPEDLLDAKAMQHIIESHVATKPTWLGNGMVSGRYQLSQKASGVSSNTTTGGNNTMHGKKPFYQINCDDDKTAYSPWARLELRSADTSQSPLISYLGLAATSLTLRLVEHKFGLGTLTRRALLRPSEVLQNVSNDVELTRPYTTITGKTMTALEYQALLAETALRLSEKVQLPSDELYAAKEWLRIVDKLQVAAKKQDFYPLVDTVEWIARRHLLSRKVGELAVAHATTEAIHADILWDRIDRPGIGMRWASKMTDTSLFTKDSVEYYAHSAPQTRASLRVAHTNQGYDIINWASLRALNKKGCTRLLTDPYGKAYLDIYDDEFEGPEPSELSGDN